MGARGDIEALTEWIKAMSAWGETVATKCRDLEARVSELEAERDRLSGRKGGTR